LNKNEVLTELEKSRQQLVDILEELSDEEMRTSGVCGKWSVKDILVHLMLWESELVKALWQAQQGGTPLPTLQDGMTDHELNEQWYQEYKDRPLENILPDFHAVRKQTLRRVSGFKEGDFNNPKRYAWLEGTPLWKRIAYDSFEHELEHLKEIESWLEAQDER
jgi:hypothetical protein